MFRSHRDHPSALLSVGHSCVLVFVVMLWGQMLTPPAAAQTSYLFFSVNGDTSATTMVQGDTLGWGADCDVGGTLWWTIVYDLDSNGVIDQPGDLIVVTFPTTDGDTSTTGEGLPDTSPVPDGWCITPPFILGVAPGVYIFEAVSASDTSSAQRSIFCQPLASPANSFSGQIVVPGHPAGDTAMLANRWMQAEAKDQEDQIWSALTNPLGEFSISIGAAGTGRVFRVGAPDLPGFVTPQALEVTASGHQVLPNFVYGLPTDSLWGYVVDEQQDPIPGTVGLFCYPTFGSGGKNAQTQNGRYVFYFSAAELGAWTLGASGSGLIPNYVLPARFSFDNSGQQSVQHDLTCFTADAVLYARVTEGGGPPAHPYRVRAEDNVLAVSTHAVSGLGTDNVVTLHIDSLSGNQWDAWIDAWDDEYPLPPGYVVGPNPGYVFGPGDTINLDIQRPCGVSDTIQGDPLDPVPLPPGLSIIVYQGLVVAGPTVAPNGVFTLDVLSGFCSLGVEAPGYYTHPPSHDLTVTRDTSGGLGFQINQAHCRVHGVLSGLGLPLGVPYAVWAYGDSSLPNYQTWTLVDMFTGEFDLYLCDGEWTLFPPSIVGYDTPDTLILDVANAPDTLRAIGFGYTSTGVHDPESGILPEGVTLFANVPNPFNPSTELRYVLPRPATVSLSIYNVLGKRVRELARGQQPAGEHAVVWDGLLASGAPAASGIYFYRLTADGYDGTRRMLLLR